MTNPDNVLLAAFPIDMEFFGYEIFCGFPMCYPGPQVLTLMLTYSELKNALLMDSGTMTHYISNRKGRAESKQNYENQGKS